MTYFRSLLVALAVGLSSQAAVAAEGVSVFSDTSRIVGIGGAITEIVFALGEQDHLVARDSTSVYPEAAFKLPDVGYMRQLSPEGVLSVNPSGILALQGSGPKEAIDVLKKASVPFIEVPENFDHQGILDRIRIVGKALGADAKANALVAETDAKLKAVENQVASVKERKRILFILSAQGGKILASGSDTAANGIIALAGGVNAVDGYTGYKQLSDEAIVTAAPDVILMMRRGGPETSDAEVLGNPAVAQTPAGETQKVIRMDGSYLLGFGPRTASAIHDLALALYGGQVAN